ncbi:odorant-binding protein 2b-like [Dama dama]
MRTLTLTLTVALGLTSALQARESLSFQGPDVSGKWFITAFVENKGLTGDRVFPVTFSVLSDTHVWASMTHRDRGYCYNVDVVLEKTNVSGTYTASRGKTHVDVEELPAKDHLLFYCEGPFEGGMFRGAKLLSRNPDVSPEALEAFKKFAQRKGFSPEDVFTPEQMGEGPARGAPGVPLWVSVTHVLARAAWLHTGTAPGEGTASAVTSDLF